MVSVGQNMLIRQTSNLSDNTPLARTRALLDIFSMVAKQKGSPGDYQDQPGYIVRHPLYAEAYSLLGEVPRRTIARYMTALKDAGQIACVVQGRYRMPSTWWVRASLADDQELVKALQAEHKRRPVQPAPEPIQSPPNGLSDPIESVTLLVREVVELRLERDKLRSRLDQIAQLMK